MILELIDAKLAKEQEDRKDRVRSGQWSPSSFGRCYRMQYWNRKNEPQTNPPDARTLRVFAAGKIFHDFVEGFLPPHQREIKVTKDDILGYADIVTDDAVYDVKSVHSQQFWHTNKDGYDINKEKYCNILQVCSYAWILGKPKGILCFISKDDLCVEEHIFFTEKWVSEIEKELNILRTFWDCQELPPCKPRAYGGKEGRYCPFKDKCGKDCK